MPAPPAKIPQSVLVVIYAADAQVLLLERADHPGFWQSVTGSRHTLDEPLRDTCRREVMEETGIDADVHQLTDWAITNQYEIYPHWRHRYPPGVTHNTEYVYGLRLQRPVVPILAPREHLRYRWLPWDEAAGQCFSWSNVQAIRLVPLKLASAASAAGSAAGEGA